eukprot:gene58306-biopygen86895
MAPQTGTCIACQYQSAGNFGGQYCSNVGACDNCVGFECTTTKKCIPHSQKCNGVPVPQGSVFGNPHSRAYDCDSTHKWCGYSRGGQAWADGFCTKDDSDEQGCPFTSPCGGSTDAPTASTKPDRALSIRITLRECVRGGLSAGQARSCIRKAVRTCIDPQFG